MFTTAGCHTTPSTSASSPANGVRQASAPETRQLPGSTGDIAAVVFTSVDCPIANAQAPQLRRVFEAAAHNGVRCYLVYPRAGITEEAMHEHALAYGLPGDRIADEGHRLVRTFDARVTPEAYVLECVAPGEWVIRYQGRINDLYTSIGNRRDIPSTHDFHEAIQAVTDGRSVQTPYPPAIGCFIERNN